MGVRDSLVYHEGTTYVGEVNWINLSLAERTVSVLEQPWADAARVEEVVYVTGERAHEVWLLESLHTDGTLGPSRPFGDTHLIGLHRALITVILTPIIRITLHEAVLHVSIDLSPILTENQLF